MIVLSQLNLNSCWGWQSNWLVESTVYPPPPPHKWWYFITSKLNLIVGSLKVSGWSPAKLPANSSNNKDEPNFKTKYCSRRWRSPVPGLRMKDPPLGAPLTWAENTVKQTCHSLKLEDEVIFSKTEDNLISFKNGRQTQCFQKWRTPPIKIEDDLIFLRKEDNPNFLKITDNLILKLKCNINQIFQKWTKTSIICKWKMTWIFLQRGYLSKANKGWLSSSKFFLCYDLFSSIYSLTATTLNEKFTSNIAFNGFNSFVYFQHLYFLEHIATLFTWKIF